MKESIKETQSTYTQLSSLLENTALKLHPSQVHGLICGILCGKSGEENGWQKLVIGEDPTAKTQALLAELYKQSAKQLDELLFDFQLVLPADSAPLPQRAEALTLWCQGFLTGLKVAEVPIEVREPGEATEAINDLVEIAKMQYEEVVESEEDEAAYLELVEYVRMAVILIYESLQEASVVTPTTDPSKHLH